MKTFFTHSYQIVFEIRARGGLKGEARGDMASDPPKKNERTKKRPSVVARLIPVKLL